MRIISDLHIHSKYSRACSQDLNPKNIGVWADKKGIGIIGTGDFTHPAWLNLLKQELEETRPGLYQLRNNMTTRPSSEALAKEDRSPAAYFLLSVEISSIYKQGDKVRRIHLLVLAPNFDAAEKFNQGLEKRGANLKADGRPITGIHCDEIVKIAQEADPDIVIIPAHAWTPHFGLFGSLSGFDSVEEAFGNESNFIFALETGLSSDPKMNWQISGLDKFSLVSNSDAHSLRKIGREANAFEVNPEKLSFQEIIRIIKSKNPAEFLYTIEFFPEEGKYHLDGHRDCKFSCEPGQTKKMAGICPVCGKKLLVGVLHRVDDLADRGYGFVPERSVPFKNVIPLEEIIAETLEVGVASKKVSAMYERMVGSVGADIIRPDNGKILSSPTGRRDSYGEFAILLDLSENQIAQISTPEIAKSIIRVREGSVHVEGGYDGVFGKIHIYDGEEKKKIFKKPEQKELF